MKYEIIKTENYLLVVDDSEIKEGDYHVAIRIVKTNGDKAIAFTDQEQLDAIAEIGGAKKIIAHLPLNNSPILQGVDLLPPLEQEDDVEKLAHSWSTMQTTRSTDYWRSMVSTYKEGYNKAKEKYKYTEEFVLMVAHRTALKFFEKGREYKSNMSIAGDPLHGVREELKDFIQSLSQPKMPIGFECQTFDTGDDKLDGTHVLGIRTTTNSQGQTQWVGKYIYA